MNTPKEMFINPAIYFSQYIADDLLQNNILNPKRKYETKFYVSSNPEQFKTASKLFYEVDRASEISLDKVFA